MPVNALSGSTDVVASNKETSQQSKVPQVIAAFALSTAIMSGQDARAADILSNHTARVEACVVNSSANLGKLKAMLEKKKAAGEMDKVLTLQAQLDESNKTIAQSCENQIVAAEQEEKSKANIAKSEANIAKSEANIATYADIKRARVELSEAVQARLKLVDDFSSGNVTEANANIALVERATTYLAKARTMLTDPESIASLNQLEKNVAMLSSRIGGGSGKKVLASNSL